MKKRSFKKFPLAALALVAGALSGRPVSGYWLARYFLGKGGEHSLPNRLERQIKFFALKQHPGESMVCQACSDWDWKFGDPNPNCVVCGGTGRVSTITFSVMPVTSTDLYTCVGGFSARMLKGGAIEYKDKYDWHAMTWQFNIRLAGLPFSVNVTGRDLWVAGLTEGKKFLTAGIISPEVEPLEPCKLSSSFDLTALKNRMRSRWRWLRRKFSGENYLSQETLKRLRDISF